MQHFYVVDYSLTGKQTNVSYTVTKLLACSLTAYKLFLTQQSAGFH